MLKLRVVILGLTAGLVVFSLALSFKYLKPALLPSTAPATQAEAELEQFESEIWPLLTRGGEAGCVQCHDADNKSDLHFFSDPQSSLAMLREKGYLATNEPDSLLGRLTTSNLKKRMPKGADAVPWTEEEIAQLRAFAGSLTHGKASAENEGFPRALLAPYRGTKPVPSDNQFITYRQLRGKVKTIFADDWIRNGRDLFDENVSLFGGADFKTRFNETSKASATFLTGLEMLSRDMASRAYSQRTGPFAGWEGPLVSPDQLAGPDASYEQRITQLYQTILFRKPSRAEMQESFDLIKKVFASREEIETGDYDLSFELSVKDPATGLMAGRTVSVPVSGSRRSLFQEWIDQTAEPLPEAAPEPAEARKPATEEKKEPPRRRDKPLSNRFAKHRLEHRFTFKKEDPGQYFKLVNANSAGNVSFHALELRRTDRPGETNAVALIKASDSALQLEGAWKLKGSGEKVSLEDENNDKGNSSITLPITVPETGDYELSLLWRFNAENAPAVLVEVASHDRGELRALSVPDAPPSGQAQFFIDESDDRIAFADLNARFRFDESDYVEIRNAGTRRRVTADAVRFVPADGGESFLVDNDEAEGREDWEVYDSGQFKAYNQTGKNTYHDKNERKGELSLRYRPAIRTNLWQTNTFYRVEVGYPAKQDHEFRAPVVVRATQSSPIIQVAYPLRANAGAEIEIDASASYTVQRAPLEFSWTQTDGPRLEGIKRDGSKLKFTVPRQDPQQLAWEALCRGLLRHPDFLFTRPPSVAGAVEPAGRRRLQLVKLALDLLGRAPTAAELQRVDRDRSLGPIVENYLGSAEFKDFYFHRIRLYLESQGSESQDEPVRLWCYVAFQNRPFQEILTADYSVNARMEKISRPPQHGRTGLLTMRGFIDGKPGLPHFNYAAQVAELFLGYVFEVPPEIVQQREGITAVATTDPASLCYSCHKILTPLAYQRTRWDDQGRFRAHDDYGLVIDDSDQQLVQSYPFPGDGLEAFATRAVKKERFIRTIINTHFTFYFGREIRYEQDERALYKRLWDEVHRNQFQIRGLIKAMLLSPEYLEGPTNGQPLPTAPVVAVVRSAEGSPGDRHPSSP